MAHPGTSSKNPSLWHDSSWSWSFELTTATLVWGGIGWALDTYVLGTAPWAMVGGFVLGFALGVYLLYLRSERIWREEHADRRRS